MKPSAYKGQLPCTTLTLQQADTLIDLYHKHGFKSASVRAWRLYGWRVVNLRDVVARNVPNWWRGDPPTAA